MSRPNENFNSKTSITSGKDARKKHLIQGHFININKTIVSARRFYTALLQRPKTRMSKVGAISKAQKTQNIFLEKDLKFLKIFFFRKMSHSAKKRKRENLLRLLTYILLQNIKKLKGGPFGDIKKYSKKVAQYRKKSKGDPLGTSGFLGFMEKVKNERGDSLD